MTDFSKEETMTTDFYTKALILSDVYRYFKEDEDWDFFFKDNSLGINFAYGLNRGLCMVSESGMPYISQTFNALLTVLNTEDTGISSMEELFLSTENGTWLLESNHEERLEKIDKIINKD
jgi:hypothetical protein